MTPRPTASRGEIVGSDQKGARAGLIPNTAFPRTQ